MNVSEFLKRIRNNNIDISINGDKIQVHSDEQIPSSILEELKANKAKILTYFKDSMNDASPMLIENAALSESYPLSSSQKRLWMLSQFEEASVAYNMPGFYEFNGDLDIVSLERALKTLIERHEILRTVFKEDASAEVRQFIRTMEELEFRLVCEELKESGDQQELIKCIVQQEIEKPFDLSNGPLLRVRLLKVSSNKYVFSYVMHHTISDGWSLRIIMKELMVLYTAFCEGSENPLLPLRIQYKDYSVWQQSQLAAAELEKHKAFWLQALSDELPVLEMPLDKQRPIIKTFKGGKVYKTFSKKKTGDIKNFCQAKGATMFMGLLAGVKVLLYKYTNQEDIIVGSAIAGRTHTDLEDQIGVYVNMLALRTRFTGEDSFSDLLDNIKEVTLKAYEHQSYPFDELIEELHLKRSMNRNPLFDISMVLQNTKISEDFSSNSNLGNITVDAYSEGQNVVSKFDLTFTFEESDDKLHPSIEYNSDVYNKETAERLLDHLEQLFTAAILSPSTPLAALDYLTKEEKQQLLVTFNDTTVSYAKDKTIIDLFAEQVSKTPDHVAVVFEDKKLTYKELNERSNELANYLLNLDQLSKGDYININIKRSEYLIIALLGILKSGFAYVLLDPFVPEERLNFILNDSGSKLLIDDAFIYHFQNLRSSLSKEKPDTTIQPSDIVYLMYTSGSTGNPKGAVNIYRGFTNTVRWYGEAIKLAESDRVGIISNLSFDLTQKNYFAPLMVGASIYIDSEFNPTVTTEFIKKHKISVINCAPTMFYSLLDEENQGDLISLKKIILGGESINLSLIKQFLETNDVNIFNSYGPSEASDVSIYYELIRGQSNIIPIGKPIWNTTVFILNNKLKLVPVGVSGEICIGGIGLGLGYLNQKTLTNEKFLHTEECGRIYRTGDIGRYNSKGEIEFIGRVDNQVKIRGHRIELEEIENKIQHFEEIIKQVCVEVKVINNEQVLIAYIVVHSSFNKSLLRENLRKKLPAYMIPSYFVELPKLPLNSNGKIDRKSLPHPQSLDLLSEVEYTAPRNQTEEQLVNIWEEILGKQRVGIDDDFFELGGHSLKTIRLISQIQKKFEVRVTVKDLFENTVLQQQADIIRKCKRTSFITIPKVREQESYPLSSSQHSFWIVSQFNEGNVAYNITSVYLFKGLLDIDALTFALSELIARHESLRTIFKKDVHGEVRQFILPAGKVDFKIGERDLRNKPDFKNILKQRVQEESLKPFDLARGSLIRASLFRIEDDQWVFAYVMHHIITDGWSMSILIDELMQLYNAYRYNKPHNLKPLRIQYKDYTFWQLERLKSESMLQDKRYWLEQFEGEIPVLELVTDKKRPAVKTYNGGIIHKAFDTEITSGIKMLSREAGATLFMGLHAAVSVLLYKYTGQRDIIIGTSIAGRDHIDLEDQIGYYLNTLALRNRFEQGYSYRQILAKSRQVTLDAYEHQAYPFEDLLKSLNHLRDISRNALFDTFMVLQNAETDAWKGQSLSDLSISGYEGEQQISKFDLTFTFMEAEDKLHLNIEYNSDLFYKATVIRVSEELERLLAAIIKNPEKPVEQLSYASIEDKYKMLAEHNYHLVDDLDHKNVVEWLETQAQKTPDSNAFLSITCRELNESANQLCDYILKKKAAGVGDLVAIRLPNSKEWTLITILAILKSGAAFIVLNEISEAQAAAASKNDLCKLIIDNTELLKFRQEKDLYATSDRSFERQPDQLAFAIFVSDAFEWLTVKNGSFLNDLVLHGNNSDECSLQELLSELPETSFGSIVEKIMKKNNTAAISENVIETLFSSGVSDEF